MQADGEITDALLDDPGDLAYESGNDFEAAETLAAAENDSEDRDDAALGVPVDITVPELSQDVIPVHLARCVECGHAVKYQASCTGASFMLVEAGESTYGIGEHGRPICPNGHGEMEIADDQLKPVPEAFADAQTMLQRAEREAVQRELPGVFPAFNYPGVMTEMEDQALLIRRLEDEHKEDADAARASKKKLDEAKDLLVAMTLKFRDRRRAKDDSDAPTTAAPVSRALACVWDKAHPDDRCPLCDAIDRPWVRNILGTAILPPDAQGHADQVTTYRERVDIDTTLEAIGGLLFDLTRENVVAWTPDQRHAVRAWVANPDSTWENIPDVFGRPHIAGAAGDQAQACQVCGSVLRTYDDAAEALPVGARVRTDCPGDEVEAHRYPDTSKPKKRSRAKAEPDPEPAPKAAKKPTRPPHKSFPKPSAKKDGKGRR